ncbi:MAG: hypothetical protein ACRDD7_13705 [Peptostreptococcaceae bacterium]
MDNSHNKYFAEMCIDNMNEEQLKLYAKTITNKFLDKMPNTGLLDVQHSLLTIQLYDKGGK